jgi:hypothetical protein
MLIKGEQKKQTLYVKTARIFMPISRSSRQIVIGMENVPSKQNYREKIKKFSVEYISLQVYG